MSQVRFFSSEEGAGVENNKQVAHELNKEAAQKGDLNAEFRIQKEYKEAARPLANPPSAPVVSPKPQNDTIEHLDFKAVLPEWTKHSDAFLLKDGNVALYKKNKNTLQIVSPISGSVLKEYQIPKSQGLFQLSNGNLVFYNNIDVQVFDPLKGKFFIKFQTAVNGCFIANTNDLLVRTFDSGWRAGLQDEPGVAFLNSKTWEIDSAIPNLPTPLFVFRLKDNTVIMGISYLDRDGQKQNEVRFYSPDWQPFYDELAIARRKYHQTEAANQNSPIFFFPNSLHRDPATYPSAIFNPEKWTKTSLRDERKPLCDDTGHAQSRDIKVPVTGRHSDITRRYRGEKSIDIYYRLALSCAALLSNDNIAIAGSGKEDLIKVYARDKLVWEAKQEGEGINKMQVLDHNLLAAAGNNKSIFIYNTEDGKLLHTIKGAAPGSNAALKFICQQYLEQQHAVENTYKINKSFLVR